MYTELQSNPNWDTWWKQISMTRTISLRITNMDVRDAWEDAINESSAYPDGTNILRATATSAEKIDCTAPLITCSHINQEALPTFHRTKNLIIHSRQQNFVKAMQSIDNFTPETGNHISSFVTVARQPCLPNGPGHYGSFTGTKDFELSNQYYYNSARAFLIPCAATKTTFHARNDSRLWRESSQQ